jgi:hypothetical protein
MPNHNSSVPSPRQTTAVPGLCRSLRPSFNLVEVNLVRPPPPAVAIAVVAARAASVEAAEDMAAAEA